MRAEVIKGLSFCYRTMLASEALLEFAIPKADGALRDYYAKHLEEERGHELMLADDLRRLGVDPIPHSHDAAKVAGAQYYLIAHEHPALLLGYMRVFEGSPITLEQVEALSDHCGTPLTCLRHHAEHDKSHKADIDAVIAALPENLRERVEWNERHTAQFLHESLDRG